MDTIATVEYDQWGNWQHPITFINWPPIDPIDHPNEPYTDETVFVNAANIATTPSWLCGSLVSYEVYPWQDFLQWEYNTCTDCNNYQDPYAGYLRHLKSFHPNAVVMLTEFGVPTSMGRTASDSSNKGRHQGGLSEMQQGQMVADMLNVAYTSGFGGAFIYELLDEWFLQVSFYIYIYIILYSYLYLYLIKNNRHGIWVNTNNHKTVLNFGKTSLIQLNISA